MATYMVTGEALYRMHRLKREMAAKKRRPGWIWPVAAILAIWLLTSI